MSMVPTLLAVALSFSLGCYCGGVLNQKYCIRAIHGYFLKKGMSWEAVDKHTAEVLDMSWDRLPFWRWKADERAQRNRKKIALKDNHGER